MEKPSVTFILGMSINDEATGNSKEFEIPQTELTWRDLSYSAVLMFEDLFVQMIRHVQDETASWGVENAEAIEKSGGDDAKRRQMLAEAMKKRQAERDKQRPGRPPRPGRPGRD